LGEVTSKPWGSIAVLKGNQQVLPIITGPARFHKGWFLRVLESELVGNDVGNLLPRAEKFRRDYGLQARDA
jgi:hypothetical protein